MPEFAEQINQVITRYTETGGWLLVPLLLTAFGIWYSYFVLLIRLKKALNTDDIEDLQLDIRLKKDSMSPADLAGTVPAGPGVTARLVRRVLVRVGHGIGLRDAFAECRDGELEYYQYAFFVMGGLVTAAPLIGLLGTVFGMIETFAAFSEQAATAQRTEQIAGGISTALITTQTGLVAALPGTIGLAHLYRLYGRLKNVVDRCESHLTLALAPGATGEPGGEVLSNSV